MIIDHTHYKYRRRRELLPEAQRHNGAYYYSREIVKNIIPLVETDRNWKGLINDEEGRSK